MEVRKLECASRYSKTNNEPLGSEEVRGLRSSPWLETCPRQSLQGMLELVPNRARFVSCRRVNAPVGLTRSSCSGRKASGSDEARLCADHYHGTHGTHGNKTH